MNERDKELARQAWTENDWDGLTISDIPKLIQLIELARADEREACASVVDQRLKFWVKSVGEDKAYKWLKNLSEAIRARGNK